MKKPRYLLWIVIVELVGVLSGILSRQGREMYALTANKPALTPPDILFPIVWTILYGLMGISAAKITASPDSRARSQGMNLFVVQLILNFFWSLLFFNVQAYGFALLWLLLLWTTTALMILRFRKVDRTAAMLQLPYLLWLSFAAYLNYGVWKLNP